MAGFELPATVVRRYVASAITLVVHLARLQGGARRVMRICELTGVENGDYTMQELFSFRQQGVDASGMAMGDFHASGQVPQLTARLAEMGIDLPVTLFAARKL